MGNFHILLGKGGAIHPMKMASTFGIECIFLLRSVDDRWRSDLFSYDLKVGVFYIVESD